MTLFKTVQQYLAHSGLRSHLVQQPIVVGVSGGADSLALLHLLVRLSPALELTLHVATLDHGLRGAAGAADARYVISMAETLGLPAYSARQDVAAIARTHGYGIEEAARRARYSFLLQVAHTTGAGIIAVGHHADDQAETVLMHLLRGTGLAGLRGMQPLAAVSHDHLLPTAPDPAGIQLIRPLLAVPRADIEQYCQQHGLEPRRDATNDAADFLRNRVRHEVLPLLVRLNPGIVETLGRNAEVLAADYEHIQQQVHAELQTLLLEARPGLLRLDREGFRRPQLTTALRRAVLREAVQRLLPQNLTSGFSSIEQAVKVAAEGETGSAADLPGGIMLRVDYGEIRLQDAQDTPPAWPLLEPAAAYEVQIPGWLSLPHASWALHTRWLAADEDASAFFGLPFSAVLTVPQPAVLSLRTRRAGDLFMPLGMDGQSQKLSDLLINLKIPAALRPSLPILTINETIAAVFCGPNSRVSEIFAVRQISSRILLVTWVGI